MRQRKPKTHSFSEKGALGQATKLLKNVDVYPKLQKEFRVQTQTGAKVSLITVVVMGILFISELVFFVTPTTSERMVVDTTINEKLKINFNISFPALNCQGKLLRVDISVFLSFNQPLI